MKSTFGLFVLALMLGCGEKPAPDGGMPAATEIEEAMSELSPADRALAEAQKTCPVSGEPLGSMGAPIKVGAEGRTVYLCCEGCRKKFQNDPAKYLAKLPK